MSFEELIANEPNLGSGQFYASYKKRPHISKSAMEREIAYAVGLNESRELSYDALGARYLYANGITYDMVLSLYDINAKQLFFGRFFYFSAIARQVAAWLSKRKRENVEARAIGMQNNESTEELMHMLQAIKGTSLMEADLFGTLERNIAIDCMLGMSFDVLLSDRLYKPGELDCHISLDDFKKANAKLH